MDADHVRLGQQVLQRSRCRCRGRRVGFRVGVPVGGDDAHPERDGPDAPRPGRSGPARRPPSSCPATAARPCGPSPPPRIERSLPRTLRVSASSRAKTCSATLSWFGARGDRDGDPPRRRRRRGRPLRIRRPARAMARSRAATSIIRAVTGSPPASRASASGMAATRSASLNRAVPGGSIGVNPASSEDLAISSGPVAERRRHDQDVRHRRAFSPERRNHGGTRVVTNSSAIEIRRILGSTGPRPCPRGPHRRGRRFRSGFNARHDGRQRVGPSEVRERLRVEDARQPLAERELAPRRLSSRNASKSRIGSQSRIPWRIRLERRCGRPDDPVVDEGGEVEPAPGDQAIRGGEPRVALDQLELTVALVPLELDVGQPPQAHLRKSFRARSHLGVPVGDVVAAVAHAGGEAPDDPLGEMEEGLVPRSSR